MAEFCRDYLETRRDEPLTIVDLGSSIITALIALYLLKQAGVMSVSTWRRAGMSI